MIDIMKIGLQSQQAIVEANKVVPIPTQKMADELHKQGKRLVHKPKSLQTFNDDDLPPEAA